MEYTLLSQNLKKRDRYIFLFDLQNYCYKQRYDLNLLLFSISFLISIIFSLWAFTGK